MDVRLVLGMLAYLIAVVVMVRRAPALAGMSFLFLFTATWRAVSSYYIDLVGPIEAVELHRAIGGSNGYFFVVSVVPYIILIAVALWVFRPSELRSLARRPEATGYAGTFLAGRRVETWILLMLVVTTFALYVELIRIGNIPVFSGMERWLYQRQFAGPVNRAYAVLMGPITWASGYVWYTSLRSGRTREAGLVLILFFMIILYLGLTGNKFSTPFYQLTIFALAPSLLLLPRPLPPAVARAAKRLVPVIVASGAMFAAAIYKVFMVDRGYSLVYLKYFLEQRTLVAPSQLSWGAFERVFLNGDWTPLEAIRLTLLDPVVGGANPSIYFLMYRELGDQLLNFQTGYTDAFPGIAFELAGPALAWPLVAVFALAFAFSARQLARRTVERRFFHALMWFVIFQAFLIFFVQGQLVFVSSWRFYLKVGICLVAVSVTVRHYRSRQRSS